MRAARVSTTTSKCPTGALRFFAARVGLVALVALAGCSQAAQSTATGAGAADAGAADAREEVDAGRVRCAIDPDVALSPRNDEDAELLAFRAAGTVAAPTAVYDRVHAELATLRAAFPEIATFRPFAEPPPIRMAFEDPAAAAERNRTSHEWDCLNERFGIVTSPVIAGDEATLSFGDRRLSLRAVSDAYAALGGLKWTASRDGVAVDLAHNVCVGIDGAIYTYVFFAGTGDCLAGCIDRTYWGYTTQPGANPTALGKAGPSRTDRPAWLTSSCMKPP